MNRRVIKCFLLSIFLFLFSSYNVKADSGSFTMGFSGPASAEVGETITINIVIKNMSEGVSGAGATLNYDRSYLQLTDKIAGSAMSVSYNNDNPARWIGVSMGGSVNSATTIVTYKFKTLKTGSTSISLSDISSTNTSYSGMQVYKENYYLTINEPLSANTALNTLSVSGTNISARNFTANVNKDVSSITINATPEDSNAKVSGTGTKTVNYGKNTYAVTVNAPNGASKEYVVTINREDPRSANNNLSSLKVSGGDLKQNFNASTTTYSMSVPFTTSSIDVKAFAEDSKSKISVSGNNNLAPGATTDVNIRVTAENGSVKNYVIKVTREKDPSIPKSNNNYLSSINASIGILSPVFNKEKTNYVIYLPYEVETIELNVELEDSSLATLDTSGPSFLNVGPNRYEFKVTAEDGTTRSYIVNVIRGASVDGASNSILLKNIEITNGKLSENFKSNIKVYKYQKDSNFKLTPVPEDENTKVSVFEFEGVYTILLESNEDANIYTLIPEDGVVITNNSSTYKGAIIATICFIPVSIGSAFLGFKYGSKKKPKKKIKEEEKYRNPFL